MNSIYQKSIFFFISLLFLQLTLAQSTKKISKSITYEIAQKHINFLASDSLLGRKAPSKELSIAANYIAEHFEHLGLMPVKGSYFQPVTLFRTRLGNKNSVILHKGSSKKALTIKKDFTPYNITGTNCVSGSLIFAGYGITAPEYDYDDYNKIDPTGKIVILLTHEPGEWDSTSIFNGTKNSRYGKLSHKVKNAIDHGAIGVILITDPLNHKFIMANGSPWPSLNKLLSHESLPYKLDKKNNDEIKVPVVQAGKSFVHFVFERIDSLIKIQEQIDNNFTPISFDIPDISIELETSTTREYATVNNVVGLIEGNDPLLKDEYLVIGAHYDHIGYLKNAKPETDSIYNGADDNASGTAALMNIASAYKNFKLPSPKRSVLFIAFTAEEIGLFGSKHYIDTPLVPLNKTIAMLNLDMLGRNHPDTLYLHNAGPNPSLVSLIKNQNKKLKTKFALVGKDISNGSDHAPFHSKGIPNIFFFTGLHEDYHNFSDNPDKIDFNKVVRVSRLVFGTSWYITNTSEYFTMPEQ